MAETMPGPAQEAYLQLANLARNWRVNLVIQLAQAPFLALLLPALAAIGAHVFLLILGGNSAGLNGTLRVMLYSTGSTAVLCFVPVPCCDSILALVWYFVAATVGLNAVHRTGTGKAVAAVLGPPALACCCYCGVSLLYGMAAGLLRAGIPTP
jgi:hypothetical protein